jgi:outer membrane cobalamin receptor
MSRSFLLGAYLVATLIASCQFAAAQSVTISGDVRDNNTHVRLKGVNIYLKNSDVGTATDYRGFFELSIPPGNPQLVVVFNHIAYEQKEIVVDSLLKESTVYLQPRVIQLEGVEIEEEGLEQIEIRKDIPQTVSVITSKTFEIQGYADAGDLLRLDHSIQLEEELSGQKTIAIRGGNSDEVVVLYDGIKLNNTYDNIFDFSLIDLENIDRLEIIKGSNTSLYGPDAFSGVINIVPKSQQPYTVRFQQRLGTYQSGNWGLHLYKKFDRLNLSYSHRRGGITRELKDVPADRSRLENSSFHHTADIGYSFSESDKGTPQNTLRFVWLYSDLDYDNARDIESLSNFNHILNLKYTGDLFMIRNLDLSVSRRQGDEDQFSTSGPVAIERGIEDKSTHVNLSKRFIVNKFDFLIGYQYQKSNLDLLDEIIGAPGTGLESADFERDHHGFLGIAKIHGETGSNLIQNIDVDFSVRHDRVADDQSNAVFRDGQNQPGLFDANDWKESVYKFSVNMVGFHNDLLFNSFLNFGSNVKFPTLYQQINTAAGALDVEQNRSFEVGAVVSKEIRNDTPVYGFQLSGNYFLNNYDNKLIEARNVLGAGARFTQNNFARISGFETQSSIFLYRKKLSIDFGWSRYFFSNQQAFPFKSDFKRTLNATIDHEGYSLKVLWFKEGQQTGIVSTNTQDLFLLELPDYSNLDLHFSKSIEIWKFKCFANFSVRNLLSDDDAELLGLTIRDRRFYLTFGANF